VTTKAAALGLLDKAKQITDRARRDGRPLNGTEEAEVNRLLGQCEAMKADSQLVDQIDRLNANLTGAPRGAVIGSDGGSIADYIVPAVLETKQSLGGGRWTTGPIELDGFDYRGIGAKAVVSEVASPVITPDYQAGIVPTLFRRLTIQDLLAAGSTDSNQITYAQETTATNAAAAVAEEGAKPESTIILTLVNDPVRKIATFLPISDEMLEDLPAARAYLDARLRLFVSHVMEAQLLNGSGTAPNIRGLLNRTGVQTLVTTAGLTGVKTIEAVFDAATLVATNAFMDADAFVIHPTDWARVRKQREDTGGAGTGGYLAGSPFGAAGGIGGVGLWGMRVVVTSAITVGTMLVGAFRQAAQAFFRSGLVVEASNSHADYFQKDITALRAEQRAALAVYRPAGFCKVTLTA
jgi:HK97 family phage major capsid protein